MLRDTPATETAEREVERDYYYSHQDTDRVGASFNTSIRIGSMIMMIGNDAKMKKNTMMMMMMIIVMRLLPMLLMIAIPLPRSRPAARGLFDPLSVGWR